MAVGVLLGVNVRVNVGVLLGVNVGVKVGEGVNVLDGVAVINWFRDSTAGTSA